MLITLRSDIGGGSKHLNSVFENLKNDFNFFIASPVNEPFGIKWRDELKEKFFQLPHRKFSIVRFLQLIFYVNKNKIRIIHAHGKGAGIYARLIKLFSPKVKIIFTWHGFHIETYNSLSKKIYLLIEKTLSKFTDLYINVSESERKICLVNKIYDEKKSIVIYNGIKDEYKPIDKSSIRQKLNLPEDKFIVINISRFDKTKNVKAFIEIASLLSINEEFFFILAGDGEEKKEILEMIEQKKINNILLPGFINNPNEYLQSSDVYLSTSLSEGLPYTLLEASMCGLPIIASDVRGNNEIVQNNFNGFLFDLRNASQAAQLISHLKSDLANYRELSDNARKNFLDKFAEQKMIFKLKEVYEKYLI
ncbi:glycosyltransferase [Ignavibacterium album]|uniref:glycosyltransferase n=1 Tax=Ignavibacterium album TaxID=591197 RepID=UPI0002DDE1F6|nr:glycosyltransferase [Ignavibacterium album]